jgi:protein gp37
MSDFLEDHPQANEIRKDAIGVLESLKYLDVLMLTKRPENAKRFLGDWFNQWPEHVWMGTSVENQETADQRIPELLRIPANIRFLSCEPLLGPVDLTNIPIPNTGVLMNSLNRASVFAPRIHWVIAGGESGPKARAMHPDWVRSLRDQCQDAGSAFHFKQWGEWLPAGQKSNGIGELPTGVKYHNFGDVISARVGKHNAGRLLYGVEWNEFPK